MGKKLTKPRIALFGMGTLDAGNLGVPVMIDLFGRLSAHYTIVFYSFLPIDTSSVPAEVIVRQPLRLRMPGRIKYLFVGIRCMWDHLFHPFALLFGVSIYPTGLCATWLGKILRVPSVVQLISTEGGTLSNPEFGNLTIPWLKKITLSVCKNADVVVTVADYQRKIARLNLKTRTAIEMLPLRINPEKFHFRSRDISEPVQFVQIAFYSPLKDQDTMFFAFSEVARKINCHLTVIGAGFDVPKIHNMMRELGIADKVTFTGYIKNDELYRYLEKSHVLLHTALFETGCAVIQEAMASGVAVCGTRVGILDDIGDRYAVVVSPGNATELAEKILELIKDEDAYRTITAQAHQFITTYDAEWAYQNYLSFINQLVDKSTRL